jgi:hypothetical protein
MVGAQLGLAAVERAQTAAARKLSNQCLSKLYALDLKVLSFKVLQQYGYVCENAHGSLAILLFYITADQSTRLTRRHNDA